MSAKSIAPHVGLLLVGALFAWRSLTHKTETIPTGGSQVWDGKADDVTRVAFESEKRKVLFEAQKDATGRYALGTVERILPAKSAVKPAGDAGVEPATPAEKRETLRFIAGKDYLELATKLSALRSTRDLGKVGTALTEYGLDGEKLPSLRVQVGKDEHVLLVGGNAPGGSDIYVTPADRSRVLVIPGNLVHDLESAETRLMERALHAFDDQDAARVLVKQAERSRELVRSSETTTFWTDPSTPAGKDETASNWMKNLQRLRVNEYVAQDVEAKPVFNVAYFDKAGKPIGNLEFAMRPKPLSAADDAARKADDKATRTEYLVRSEHTRWWGSVLPASGEPLAQDLASILK